MELSVVKSSWNPIPLNPEKDRNSLSLPQLGCTTAPRKYYLAIVPVAGPKANRVRNLECDWKHRRNRYAYRISPTVPEDLGSSRTRAHPMSDKIRQTWGNPASSGRVYHGVAGSMIRSTGFPFTLCRGKYTRCVSGST